MGTATFSCQLAPGVGSGLQWQVSVAGQTTSSFSGKDTAYQAPTISGLSGAAANAAGTSTQGGIQLILAGTNFGPAGQPGYNPHENYMGFGPGRKGHWCVLSTALHCAVVVL